MLLKTQNTNQTQNSKMKTIKFFGALTIFFSFMTFVGHAQDKSDRPSPPQTAEATVKGTKVLIDYSSPAAKGRDLYGDLVPYGKIWRTGANEATTVTVDKDVKIGGKTLKAGKYALFTIPGENDWEIIINSEWDQWGAYNYDASKDVLRTSVKPMKTDSNVESLRFNIDEGGLVVMAWGDTQVPFKIE
jgi:hypothetical protein